MDDIETMLTQVALKQGELNALLLNVLKAQEKKDQWQIIAQASESTGWSVRTIQGWVADKKIITRKCGGSVLVKISSLPTKGGD